MGRETDMRELENCDVSKKSIPTGNILQNLCYDSFPWGATKNANYSVSQS